MTVDLSLFAENLGEIINYSAPVYGGVVESRPIYGMRQIVVHEIFRILMLTATALSIKVAEIVTIINFKFVSILFPQSFCKKALQNGVLGNN